jgi:hypothetical protein
MDRLKTLAAVMGLIACVSTLSAQTLHLRSPRYDIDWAGQTLTVSGTGEVDLEDGVNPADRQLRAARDAEEELLASFISSLQELRIDAYRTARDVLLQEPGKSGPLYAYFARMERVSVRYGEHTVVLRKNLPLFGEEGFMHLLVDAGTDPGNFPGYDEYLFSRPFTGLVVDARGMGKVPSADPRIFDQSHTLVYSSELMETEWYRRWGSVRFTRDPSYRKHRERVGEYPLRVAAFPDERLIETDLAVLTADAVTLLQHPDSRRSLLEGRVVVILDE